jgi:type I restriction enzyme, R subunit
VRNPALAGAYRVKRSLNRIRCAGSRTPSPGPDRIVESRGYPPAVIPDEHDYLAREARARVEMDRQLRLAGWLVQNVDAANITAGPGVAVREFILEKGHGRVDYLLFVDGEPAGVIEAKPEGTTLTEVEHQSGKYVDGLPDWMTPRVYPLPFIYESTGKETRFTNGYDPEPRSRRVFTIHRPETLAEWARQIRTNPECPTFRTKLRSLPDLDASKLWSVQANAIRNLEESLHDDRPRSLIQMATGSGKTFTAANICYRLIKHAGAKRILFLVDRANLGKQTMQEGLPRSSYLTVAMRSSP